jgi:hypothetical protein
MMPPEEGFTKRAIWIIVVFVKGIWIVNSQVRCRKVERAVVIASAKAVAAIICKLVNV